MTAVSGALEIGGRAVVTQLCGSFMRVPVSRLYQVRAGLFGWARIWVTDDGSISILSDYGNYGYWFGAPGKEFRAFLIGAGKDYLVNKFTSGSPEVIDADASEKKIRRHILRLRRDRDLSREQARDEWELLKEHHDFDDLFNQVDWWRATTFEMTEPLFVYHRRSLRAVEALMEKVWPLFVAQLAAERAQEQADLTQCLDAAGVDLKDSDIQAFIRW